MCVSFVRLLTAWLVRTWIMEFPPVVVVVVVWWLLLVDCGSTRAAVNENGLLLEIVRTG